MKVILRVVIILMCINFEVVPELIHEDSIEPQRGLVTKIKKKCCDGWKAKNHIDCDYALCDNKTNPDACKRNEGYVRYKNGTIVRNSGGSCEEPNQCVSCHKDGYYAHGPYCRACKQIDHCDISRCSNADDTRCTLCEGEHVSEYGKYAYTRFLDDGKSCKQACSWRNGSRCFPGNCSDTTNVTCKCINGFTGPDCDQITIHSFIPDKYLKLIDGTEKVEAPPNRTGGDGQPPTWTNLKPNPKNTLMANAILSGVFNPEFPNYTPPYIIKNNTDVGIIYGKVQLDLYKADGTKIAGTYGECDLGVNHTKRQNFACEQNFTLNSWPTFDHLYRILFTVEVKNGGRVSIINFDNNELQEQYLLNGLTTQYSFDIIFDYKEPMHCIEEQGSHCTKESLIVPDVTKTSSLLISWDGWKDTDSGIHTYEIQVFRLQPGGKDGNTTQLIHGDVVVGTPTPIAASLSPINVSLKVAGAYSVLLTVIDKAGNTKSSRRLLIFDNISKIEKMNNPPRVTSASRETNYNWITEKCTTVHIEWHNRFINQVHERNGWLNSVKEVLGDSRLDDNEGERQIHRKDNIQGIVRFEVSYETIYEGNTTYYPLKIIPEIHSESADLKEDIVDGKRLVIHVRGYDIMENCAEDVVNVTFDTSPPVIENLWLTRGDYINITVHSLREFANLTIEWLAYDFHSGIDFVRWKLYDNHTGQRIVHGMDTLSPQGDAADLEKCRNKYMNYTYGADCYCTPFDGCYHRHFSVQPHDSNVKNQGLRPYNNKGVHNGDYFFEVVVKNRAKLKTTLTMKVTIDTSPPQEGSVHEGFPGQPELDFQQSRIIHAYWDGFFDKESGILFFRYGFSDKCLPADQFVMSKKNDSVLKDTYLSSATYNVSSEGKYFVTVVGYNRALEPSVPVCSDGIMIDTSLPKVSEVHLEHVRIRSGLVKDFNDTVWYLDENRNLYKVRDPSLSCRSKATRKSDEELSLYPKARSDGGEYKGIPAKIVCDNNIGALDRIIGVFSAPVHFQMSWKVSGTNSEIFDYNVGIASTDSTTPDRFDFISTKQHANIHIPFPNIDDGELFYVLVKAISKSEMESIRAIGPFLVDSTPPKSSGEISVTLRDGYLMATWADGTFWDNEDIAPLQYYIAIGHSVYGTDVLPFTNVLAKHMCPSTNKTITCAAVHITNLQWQLHGHHTYYISIKAENTGGLFVLAKAKPYIHDIQVPSAGVVYEVDPIRNNELQDIEDIDFQTNTASLSAKWYGFVHPHLEMTYILCISNASILIHCEDVGNATIYTLKSIRLEYFKTYFVTIVATTTAGNTSITSDGVTVVKEGAYLAGIRVLDGHYCINKTRINVTFGHHSEDKRILCRDDVDYQISLNTIEAHWYVPEETRMYTPGVYWSIEESAPLGDIWSTFREYEYIHMTDHVQESGIDLQAGRKYRVTVKFCAGQICFRPVYSNGVRITPRPPLTGTISVQYSSESNKIYTIMEQFYDPDVEEKREAVKVMDRYEWAFTDNSHVGSTVTVWERIDNIIPINSTHVSFTIDVLTNVSFTKCWRLAIRGYSIAGLSSELSSDIRSCSERESVRENIVLDVTVDSHSITESKFEDGHGHMISLEENTNWPGSDVDYTPYQNILSAVWPKLRYPAYIWGVLEDTTVDPTTFYKQDVVLELRNPCSHPNALQCGTTDNEYVNVKFDNGVLENGKRYVICIHANTTLIKHEKWDERLPELSACSDGVTVDLTPPQPGRVWLGVEIGTHYQGSKSDISVNWESFQDIEELGHSVHSSGIKEYYLALGTSPGNVDLMQFKNVGITNHATIHGLKLQNGHTYYATIKAFDYVNRTSVSTSPGITVDYTAPKKTSHVISINDRHLTDVNQVSVCWTGLFEDKESGIAKYEWAVGSQPGYCDIVPYTTVYEECSETSSNSKINLHEGHTYFVSVKGYNRVGLSDTAVSWAFTVDTSPPHPGYVYDGKPDLGKAIKDIDFTTNKFSLDAYWGAYNDPHTAIQEYFINIGTCRGCEDVLKYQPVGIVYEFHVQHLHLIEGIAYYTTVTACNTANLCTSVTSDGIQIDTSSPVRGRVQDGSDPEDIQYQTSSNSIAAKWFGFSDPQSGISYYIWRAGTYPGADDVLEATMLHRNQLAVIPDFKEHTGRILPLRRRIYITVRAYNNAGKYSEATSNGFIVDPSPPTIVSPPRLVDLGIIVPNTTVSKTTLRVEWNAQDNESYIQKQYLSIKSHVRGDFNASSIQIGGMVRDYTFVGLDLHDGSQYCITLIVCNGAKQCADAMTPLFLVDSSPPTPGMFAIDTDHAANLKRQPNEWMKWSIFNVDLAWLGFTDLHSEIISYKINIGSTYMGSDRNMNHKEPFTVTHNMSGKKNVDEGTVQTYRIPTQSLNHNETIYISMWAVNGVGLRSRMVHSQFHLRYGGLMELVRRCSAYSCLGHCVCAPQEGKCELPGIKCSNISKTAERGLKVIDIQDLSDPVNAPQVQYSAADCFMAARWTGDDVVIWYEWSIGWSSNDMPTGVFSTPYESVWHHAGEEKYMIYSFPKNKCLHDGLQYSIFVRAWYNEGTYAVFKSPGVYINAKPPRTTNINGKAVKETLGNLTKDIDFAKLDDEIYVDWSGKFQDSESGRLKMFRLYISTYPGGHDIHTVDDELDPEINRFRLTLQSVEPRTRYYANIQAYSKAGVHTTVTSDGFMIDVDPPEAGMVYDGKGWRDIEFQNNSTVLGASWHGFSDLESGISQYIWCSTTYSALDSCSVIPWNYMGLSTSGILKSNKIVDNGEKIIHKVYALDGVGHTSLVAESDGVTIDLTAPVREDASLFLDKNNVENPSFEKDNFGKTCMEIEHLADCGNQVITGWISTPDTCVWLATTSIHHAQDGNSFLVVKGSIQQSIQGLEKNQNYRIVFYTSHLPFAYSVAASNEGFIKIDETMHVFLLYNRIHRHDTWNTSQTIMIWHPHEFFFRSRSSNVTLEIGSTERSTGVAIDNVQVQKNVPRTDYFMEQSHHVQAHAVFLHDWTSVHASWNFVDPESPIVDYTWGIGYTVGGTQLQDFNSLGLRTFAYNSSLKLIQNSRVHVTVVATNTAGLKAVSYSEPIIVDLTPPVFEVVNDGEGTDVDFQDTPVITASWEVSDVESGINECQWAIGTRPDGKDLQNYTRVDNGRRFVSKEFSSSDVRDKTVFVTIKCENGAGLLALGSTDGVRVVQSAPSAENVDIIVFGTSTSVYFPHDYFHGDPSSIRVRWSGFLDDFGIEMCEVTLQGPGTKVTELVAVDSQGYMCTDFNGLQMKDGLYQVSVTGINSVKMKTEIRVRNFTLVTKPPYIQVGRTISLSWNPLMESVTANWDAVFSSDHPLQYEVSAGTVQGGSDIIQWQETKQTRLVFSFEKEVIGPTGKDIFVSVRAISPSGLYEIANAQILVTS